MAKVTMSQIAAMNQHYVLYSFEYFLDSVVGLGVENIELWAGSPHLYVDDLTLLQVERISREIRRRDLNLVCYTPEQRTYPINIAAKELHIRDRSLNYIIKNMQVAAELGTKLFQIVPGWGYLTEPVEEAWKRSRDSLDILVRKAEELGITIVLEQLECKESNLITNLQSQQRMLMDIGSSKLKAVINTCPMYGSGETFDDYFDALGEDVRHIHFNDSNHLAWGDGTFPIKCFLEQIDNGNYGGYLTIQIYSTRYYLDPVRALKQSVDTIKESISLLREA